ncbi:MAG: hypothetical protein WC523_00700 [Patescibacteria group bacterium]
MGYETSEVMREFMKIMAEQETPAKNPYAEDKKIIEEKREFPEEDLIEQAHPEKVYVAESRGDGGLVENQNEQHEKMMTVINKMPTGALLGTYASAVTTLTKMADICDELGDSESADALTNVAEKVLALMDNCPFDRGTCIKDGEVSPLHKEADGRTCGAIKEINRHLSDAKFYAVKGDSVEMTIALDRARHLAYMFGGTMPSKVMIVREKIMALWRGEITLEESAQTTFIKSAGIITAIPKLIWWLTKNTFKLGGAAAGKVAEATPEVAGALKLWWKSGKATKSSEQIAEHADDILRDLTSVTESVTKHSQDIKESLSIASKSLADQITKLQSAVNANESEAGRLLRSIEKNKIMAKNRPELANELIRKSDEDIIQRNKLLENIKGDKSYINTLISIRQVASEPGGESTALAMMKNNPQLQQYSGTWLENMKKAFDTNAMVLSAKSKNLNNDAAFLQEYLALKRTSGAEEMRKLFEANPDNIAKLLQLNSTDRIAKIIESGKIPLRNKLFGLTVQDQAKTLGLPVTVLAGGAAATLGAIGVFDWFHKNDPSQVVRAAQNVKDPLSKVRTYGPGQDIVNKVKTSMNNIDEMQKLINDGLESNPEQSISKYVSGMSKELKSLNDAVSQWNLVEENAEDKSVAEQAKNQIIDFVYKLALSFNDLASRVGVPGVQAPSKQTNKPGQTNDNVTKIQSFLKIPATGTLDSATVSSLQKLEQDFNNKQKTNEFTGVFVQPAINFVIDYSNLMNIVKKY